MLLLNEVRFEPDAVYELERPLLLLPGDEVHRHGQRVVVRRAVGRVESPAGHWEPWCWDWRLL